MASNNTVVAGFILLIVLVIVLGPLLTIWSLNALFGLAISYTLKTWFAALVLGALVGSSSVGSK